MHLGHSALRIPAVTAFYTEYFSKALASLTYAHPFQRLNKQGAYRRFGVKGLEFKIFFRACPQTIRSTCMRKHNQVVSATGIFLVTLFMGVTVYMGVIYLVSCTVFIVMQQQQQQQQQNFHNATFTICSMAYIYIYIYFGSSNSSAVNNSRWSWTYLSC